MRLILSTPTPPHLHTYHPSHSSLHTYHPSHSSLAHPGADSVSPDVLAAVSDQERKRQEAIFELLSSERNYVDSLKLVMEVR